MAFFLFLQTTLLGTALFLMGCDVPPVVHHQDEVNSKHIIADIVLEQPVKSIGPLIIGMTAGQIESLNLPFKKQVKNVESDEYVIYLVTLPEGLILESMLSSEGQIYSIKASSSYITDEFGNRVGTSLKELKKSYPDGRLIHGFADGRFLRFLTATPLIFSMDKSVVPENCFEAGASCNMPEDLKVIGLEVGSYSPK